MKRKEISPGIKKTIVPGPNDFVEPPSLNKTLDVDGPENPLQNPSIFTDKVEQNVVLDCNNPIKSPSPNKTVDVHDGSEKPSIFTD